MGIKQSLISNVDNKTLRMVEAMLSVMGIICKIFEKDGRLFPTHSFTRNSNIIRKDMHFNENVPYRDDITPAQYKAKNKELGAEVKKCYEIRRETMKNQAEAMIEQEKS